MKIRILKHMLRSDSPLGISRGKCTAEMNPIEGPGFGITGRVGMRLSGRQDEKLVGTNGILLVANAISPFSVHTVYQHILLYPLRSAAIMIHRMGIIAYIRDIKTGEQSILTLPFHDHPRQDDGSFTTESFFLFHVCKDTTFSQNTIKQSDDCPLNLIFLSILRLAKQA